MAEQWERLPELFSYIEKLKADGMSDEQIADHLTEIDQYEMDVLREQHVANGGTAEAFDAFFEEIRADLSRGHEDEGESFDASDEGGA